MCTFDSCFKAEKMFERRRDWINHEMQLHRREWACNVGGHPNYHDQGKFTEHLRCEHAEMGAKNDLASIVSLFERPSTTSKAPCPFCLSEDTKDLSISRLEKHIAQHMETLALFALPLSHGIDEKTSFYSAARAEMSHGSSSDLSHDVDSSKIFEIDAYDQPSADFDELDHFSDLINDFVLANMSLSIPKQCLEGLTVKEQYTPGIQDISLRQRLLDILRMSVETQAHETIQLCEYLLQLRLNLFTLVKFGEKTKRPEALFLTGVVLALAHNLSQTSLRSNDRILLDPANQLYELGRMLSFYLTGEVEAEAMSETHSQIPDINWDHIQPKIPLATTTISLLSRTRTRCNSILNAPTTTSEPMQETIRTIAGKLGLILHLLQDAELDHDIAKAMEREFWSHEEQVFSFCNAIEGPTDDGSQLVILAMTEELLALFQSSLSPKRDQDLTEGTSRPDEESKDTDTMKMMDYCVTQSVKHQAVHDALCPGTFAWFFDSSLYTDWVQGECRILEVQGNPGCGKSVLCSAVIEALKDQRTDILGADVVYYYTPDPNFNRVNSYEVLSSLAMQICERFGTIPEGIRKLLVDIGTSDVSDETLATSLKPILSSEAPSYLVIDGFDHISDSPRVLKWLLSILDRYTQLKCMITYRMTYHIPAWASKRNRFTIDEKHVKSNISFVLNRELPQDLQSAAEVRIQKEARGM